MPFAAPLVIRRIEKKGGKPAIREAIRKVGPVITDNGNLIIDAIFGPIRKPLELETQIKTLPGVVETGLFVGMANIVYVGKTSGVEKHEKTITS